jgi:Domain of unknown function (DUF4249)
LSIKPLALLFTSLVILSAGCRKPYIPTISKESVNYLVVDGVLLGGNDSTIINLTRTRSLTDTLPRIAEPGAQLSVEGEFGEQFPLYEIGDGAYGTDHLTLTPSANYRLRISTANGKHYLSDYVPFKPTPAIDSLNWQQDPTGITINVNSHDPQNQTRYYRWAYEQTWEYHTFIESDLDLVNNMVQLRNPSDHIYYCWSTTHSTDLLIGSTVKLSQDVVFMHPLNFLPTGAEQLSIYYSILVKQYALTGEAYTYWEQLKNNTEQIGGIFGAQPNEMTGNFHCVENANEPVLGYLSSSTVEKKRIFINALNVPDWYYKPYYQSCMEIEAIQQIVSPSDQRRIDEYLLSPNHLYIFWYVDGFGAYHVAQKFCADCREHGGTNRKPSFWP